MDWLSKIKDFLSLGRREVFIAATLAWAFLLIPSPAANLLGIAELRDLIRPYVGLAALGFSVWLLAGVAMWVCC